MALRIYLSQHRWLNHITRHGAILLLPYLPTCIPTYHLPYLHIYYYYYYYDYYYYY